METTSPSWSLNPSHKGKGDSSGEKERWDIPRRLNPSHKGKGDSVYMSIEHSHPSLNPSHKGKGDSFYEY